MTSPPDLRTGVQSTRRFTLVPGSSRVSVDLTFRNISDRPIHWSIWDVVQLRAEHTVADGGERTRSFLHGDGAGEPAEPFRSAAFNVMFGAEDNPQWQVTDGSVPRRLPWEIGKVGLDSTAGWIAFHQASQQAAFVERF